MRSSNPLRVAVDLNSPFSNMQIVRAAKRPIRYVGNEAQRSNLLPLITYESFGKRERDLVYGANTQARKVICFKVEKKKKR